MERKRAVKHEYFEEISNVKFDHPAIPFAASVYGPVQKITMCEAEATLRKIKSGKATGPDDMPADLWNSKGWCPADWLTEFSNQVVAEKKELAAKHDHPNLKNKGSLADCASYRPIRLFSHTMKIPDRIVDGGKRDVVSTNQCGLVCGCGTVDAIHAVRLLLEKHHEKQKPVHFAFLDLEKAFDRVLREVLRYVSREHGTPEELIVWVRILNSCPRSRVRAPAGTSMEFSITVGVNLGSALSLQPFVIVMDAISRDLQMAAP
ncbi:unnamed protein product [Heligmosomoides polygyrus]|uniref:Reverse transcriptase domain-containing protein n=1 Tax=Heligmosomoides polygyrus TaxID=6339 RepID=A0A183FME2_HELPZ|nr:unnamed protein product [Heligmosomoides polygyrus]